MASQNADDKQSWRAQIPRKTSIAKLPPVDLGIIIKVEADRQ